MDEVGIHITQKEATVNKTQLKEMGICSFERLRQAIEAGDKKKALALLDETAKGVDSFSNVRTGQIDLLLTYIADKLGDDAVYEVQELTYNKYVKPFLGADAVKWSAEDKLKKRCYVWTFGHAMTRNIEIEEDKEKFTLRIPCNTGGWLKSAGDYGTVGKAYPWTRARKDYCLYCTGSAAGECITVEEYGVPVWIGDPQEPPTCLLYIYKDNKDIPAEYFERVKTKKPARAAKARQKK